MDFSYTDEQEEFRQELRTWLEKNVPEEWRDGGPDLPDDPDERWEKRVEWHRTLNEGGWVGIHWPEEYGGRGATLEQQAIYNEEMARWDTPRTVNGIGIGFVGPTLVAAGTEEQKERFVSNILGAEEIWCQGYSEPGAGSDIASLTTEAETDGDQWVINGQKIWTSNAQRADWCFLLARTDFSGTKHEGITAFLVPMDQDGIEMEPIHQASDSYGFNQWYLDDVVTDEEMVVGEVDKGWEVAMTLSAFERANLSPIHGLEQTYLDILEYCKETTRNGKPLVEDPDIRRQLADFDARIQAQKAVNYRSLSQRSATGTPGPEGSMDNLVTDELAIELNELGAKVMGPEASLWEDTRNGGSWQTRAIGAIGGWIAGGTGDVQRNIIGERVLGLPKDIKSDTSHRE
jgi:alkylation response protein AidB-like acyl-CoA dehydrogenase